MKNTYRTQTVISEHNIESELAGPITLYKILAGFVSLKGLQENPRNSRSFASQVITRFLFSEAVYSFQNDVLHTLRSETIITLTVKLRSLILFTREQCERIDRPLSDVVK